MEVQLTDFENAAFTVFSVLLSRVILFFKLNLYLPLSRVDENMAAARLRDAITTQKFYFRRQVVPLEDKCPGIAPLPEGSDPDEFVLMSCEEILMGKVRVGGWLVGGGFFCASHPAVVCCVCFVGAGRPLPWLDSPHLFLPRHHRVRP